MSFESLRADSSATANDPVAGLVYLDGANPVLVALRKGRLSKRFRVRGSTWQPVPTTEDANPVYLESIVPVLDEANQFATSAARGMVGVSDAGKLYSVNSSGACTLLTSNAAAGVRPIAVWTGGHLVVAFAQSGTTNHVVSHD